MRTIAWLTAALVGFLIAGCAGVTSAPSQEERQALAPTGKLRVALYTGAPASIIRGGTPDESKGVGFDLGKELARRIGVPFEPVVYPSPGAIMDGLKAGEWGGYAGGDAPGLAFETAEWIHKKEIAAICTDTWGCEVRPNESEAGINQPWHWITIPIMGMTMGEIFYLKELAEDCAADNVYEFMFVAPAIPITGAVGSPTNPLAIK